MSSTLAADGTRAEVRVTRQPAVSCTLYNSIDDVDAGDWDAARVEDRGPFMDIRFVRAVEQAFAGEAKFFYAVFRNAANAVVATACFCAYQVDATLLADGLAKKIATRVAPFIPGRLRFPVLFCGLPVSAAQSSLRILPGDHVPAVLKELDAVCLKLARQTGAHCIVAKEFTDAERAIVDGLQPLGYRRADSLPMNVAVPGFASFEAFYNSLKSSKRHPIRTSQNKFAKSGLRVEQLRGGDEVAQRYTDAVHRLYENVLEKAAVRLERLPAAFFRNIARELPDETSFTFVLDGESVVGFAASIFSASHFHQMFVGVDHEVNATTDLYFNMFFHALDVAYRQDVAEIVVGQSADTFKQRKLLCTPHPLSFYVKGYGFGSAWVIRNFFNVLFPPRPVNAAAAGGSTESSAGASAKPAV